MGKLIIYGLIDPRSGELRYVGKSSSGMTRPMSHSKPSVLKKETNHCRNWLKGLISSGLKPEVEVLEIHETATALSEAEKHFIAYFRSIGCRLTNLTDGGEGRGRSMSPETRAKIAAALRGKRLSAEHRAKLSAAHRGLVCSARHRASLSAALLGKVHTPEHRSRNSKSKGGRPFHDQNGVEYETQAQAARALGLWQGNIGKVLSGQFESTGGYKFRFSEQG